MSLRVSGTLAALALGAGLSLPCRAENKPSIVIMPTQYFSADADSAANVTQGLVDQFEHQGYKVMSMDQSRSTWTSMNLSPNTHYPDRVAVRFGRGAHADLVAYPRLLAVGIPINAPTAGTTSTTTTTGGTTTTATSDLMSPAAVIHLRVLNVHTGGAIYFRQVAHEFTTDTPVTTAGDFHLPQPVATATATDVTSVYFQRVAGSRQEFGTTPIHRMRRHHYRMRRHHRMWHHHMWRHRRMRHHR